MSLSTIEELINDIRQGKMVILIDDEDRENEGDLVMAASFVTADDINFYGTLCPRVNLSNADPRTLPAIEPTIDDESILREMRDQFYRFY